MGAAQGANMGIGNEDKTAFSFEGNWREYAPIAFTNILLTFVTLGVYRFWATTRERRYFWSKTRFIDDRFEWTGTGLELLFGFLIALVLFVLPFFLLNLILNGLILQSYQEIAATIGGILYFFLIYLSGVAIFRGLRYRLSRTYWHGIHGGTDQNGLGYGWSWIWKSIVAYLCLALLFPWSMTSLWKQRWEAMSFGPHAFRSNPEWSKLMGRYILAYLAPIGLVIVLVVLAVPAGMAIGMTGGSEPNPVLIGILIGVFVLAFYIIWPLIALIFYAAYVREVIGTMELSTLEFEFTASTKDWVKLFIGNVGLWLAAGLLAAIPIAALGLFNQFTKIEPGQTAFASNPFAFFAFMLLLAIPFSVVGPFVRYRGWAFYVRHMEAGGEINLAALTQSETRELKQGEGLLDAFDMGAI
jgi:uncharacterized membrane protein YjgN (DUF898 family)